MIPPKCPACGKYWHIKCRDNLYYADHICTFSKRENVVFDRYYKSERDLYHALVQYEMEEFVPFYERVL